jgi:hypothetical protein
MVIVWHHKQYMCQETNQKEVDKGVEDKIQKVIYPLINTHSNLDRSHNTFK